MSFVIKMTEIAERHVLICAIAGTIYEVQSLPTGSVFVIGRTLFPPREAWSKATISLCAEDKFVVLSDEEVMELRLSYEAKA